MSSPHELQPNWSNAVAAPDSYRSVFKYAPDKFKHPSPGWVEVFKSEFAMTDADFQQRRLTGDEAVQVERKCALTSEQIEAFAQIVGRDNVATDDYSRAKYGTGKAMDEDMDLRAHVVRGAVDLVLHPRNTQDVIHIVAYCNAARIAITPYGGGSGCVVGNQADRGGVAVVMRTHMNKIVRLDEENQVCHVQPGMMGPDYEGALNRAPELFGAKRAYTCGHFPQSFELASVGGWITALGSGQASTYYGDACDIVQSQEYVTPAGIIKTSDIPASAAGPKVNDILKGNEGTFGILVDVGMKIFRHRPENTQRFAYMYPNWQAAVDASREIVQGEFGKPAVFRISDPEETELGLKLKGFDASWGNSLLQAFGQQRMQRCLGVGTVEGEKGFAVNVKKNVSRIARAHGALPLSGWATKQWEHGRYSDVHMREDMLDFGILIDTLETGVTWDNLMNVHRGVREFVKQRPGTICMTHASHFYPQGTNLYFILIMKPKDHDEFKRFRADVVSKIVELGGSLSHHHGVGRLFAPWMERSLGREQMEVLRALKRHFDPNDIMNPGAIFGPMAG